MTRRPFKKITAVFVLCCFGLTQQSLPKVYAAPAEAPASAESFQALDVEKLNLSRGLGKVEEIYKGTQNQTVILIQDAHAIPDAQKSIQRLIAHFQKNYGIHFVGLEGASSYLDPQIFKSFPQQDVMREVFRDYLDKGELTAGTASAVFNSAESDYAGLEDWTLYQDGLRYYLLAQKSQPELLQILEARDEAISVQKEAVYSPALKEADDALTNFRKEKEDLLSVLQVLAKTKKPAEGSRLRLILDEAAGGEDRDRANEAEVRKLAEIFDRPQITNRMPRTLYKEFQLKRQQFQTSQLSSSEFALYLSQLASSLKIPVPVSDKLISSMQITKQLKNIEGAWFFREFREYIREVKDLLIENADQRALDFQSEERDVLERFARLQLDQPDWKKIRDWMRNPSQRTLDVPSEKFSFQYAFYLNAKKRDKVLFDRLIAAKSRNGEEVRNSLMVAGGFHAEGLTQLFRQRGISYAVLMPEISKLPDENHYEEQMKGGVSWKDHLRVENGKIDLYSAFVRGTRDKMIETLRNAGLGEFKGRTLKAWRDQIIRDLSEQGRIAEASRYTRYIDEAVEQGDEDDATLAMIESVKKFISGMKDLDQSGRLTPQNVAGLLTPSMLIQAAPAAAAAPDDVLDQEFINFDAGFVPVEIQVSADGMASLEAEVPDGIQETVRSELRSLEQVPESVKEKFDAFVSYVNGEVRDDAEVRRLWDELGAAQNDANSVFSNEQLQTIIGLAHNHGDKLSPIMSLIQNRLARHRTPEDVAAALSLWAQIKLAPVFAAPDDPANAAVITEGSKNETRFREQYALLAPILLNAEKSKALQEVLTTFRNLLEWRKLKVNAEVPGNEKPIEWIKSNAQPIQIADGVFVRSDTGSFRRHVLYGADAQGQPLYAVELKIVGEKTDKRKIDPEDYTVSEVFREKSSELKARTQEPLFVLQHPGEAVFQSYGTPVALENQNTIVLSYDMKRHDQRARMEDYLGQVPVLLFGGGKIKQRVPDSQVKDVVEQVVLILRNIFESGYYGQADLSHLQNFGIEELEDGRFFITLPNDFGDFVKIGAISPDVTQETVEAFKDGLSSADRNWIKAPTITLSNKLKKAFPAHKALIDEAFSAIDIDNPSNTLLVGDKAVRRDSPRSELRTALGPGQDEAVPGPLILNQLQSLTSMDAKISNELVERYINRGIDRLITESRLYPDAPYKSIIESRQAQISLIRAGSPEAAILKLHEKAELNHLLENRARFGITDHDLYDRGRESTENFLKAFLESYEKAVEAELAYVSELKGKRFTDLEPRYLLIGHPLYVNEFLKDSAVGRGMFADRVKRLFPEGAPSSVELSQAISYYRGLGADYGKTFAANLADEVIAKWTASAARSELRASADVPDAQAKPRTALETFGIKGETRNPLEGKLTSEVVWNNEVLKLMSDRDREKMERVLTQGDDLLTLMIQTLLEASENRRSLFAAPARALNRLLMFLNRFLANHFNKPYAVGEYAHSRTIVFRLSQPVVINDRVFKAIKLKGTRVPAKGEIKSFNQMMDRQPSLYFFVNEKGQPRLGRSWAQPYRAMRAGDAQTEYYASLAMSQAGTLTNAPVAYGVYKDRDFSYLTNEGQKTSASVGYYVSLIDEESDVRLYQTVRRTVSQAYRAYRKNNLSPSDAEGLRGYLHELFEQYGSALRGLNESYIHYAPHSGNVNLVDGKFNFQDNDAVIPRTTLTQREQLGFLMNDLFQFLNAVHEFEKTEIPGGAQSRLYSEEQAGVVEFLRSLGVNLQRAALKGYFKNSAGDSRITKIEDSSSVDNALFPNLSSEIVLPGINEKTFDAYHPIASLMAEEFGLDAAGVADSEARSELRGEDLQSLENAEQISRDLQSLTENLLAPAAANEQKLNALFGLYYLKTLYGPDILSSEARRAISSFSERAIQSPRVPPASENEIVIHGTFSNEKELRDYVEASENVVFAVIPPMENWEPSLYPTTFSLAAIPEGFRVSYFSSRQGDLGPKWISEKEKAFEELSKAKFFKKGSLIIAFRATEALGVPPEAFLRLAETLVATRLKGPVNAAEKERQMELNSKFSKEVKRTAEPLAAQRNFEQAVLYLPDKFDSRDLRITASLTAEGGTDQDYIEELEKRVQILDLLADEASFQIGFSQLDFKAVRDKIRILLEEARAALREDRLDRAVVGGRYRGLVSDFPNNISIQKPFGLFKNIGARQMALQRVIMQSSIARLRKVERALELGQSNENVQNFRKGLGSLEKISGQAAPAAGAERTFFRDLDYTSYEDLYRDVSQLARENPYKDFAAKLLSALTPLEFQGFMEYWNSVVASTESPAALSENETDLKLAYQEERRFQTAWNAVYLAAENYVTDKLGLDKASAFEYLKPVRLSAEDRSHKILKGLGAVEGTVERARAVTYLRYLSISGRINERTDFTLRTKSGKSYPVSVIKKTLRRAEFDTENNAIILHNTSPLSFLTAARVVPVTLALFVAGAFVPALTATTALTALFFFMLLAPLGLVFINFAGRLLPSHPLNLLGFEIDLGGVHKRGSGAVDAQRFQAISLDGRTSARHEAEHRDLNRLIFRDSHIGLPALLDEAHAQFRGHGKTEAGRRFLDGFHWFLASMNLIYEGYTGKFLSETPRSTARQQTRSIVRALKTLDRLDYNALQTRTIIAEITNREMSLNDFLNLFALQPGEDASAYDARIRAFADQLLAEREQRIERVEAFREEISLQSKSELRTDTKEDGGLSDVVFERIRNSWGMYGHEVSVAEFSGVLLALESPDGKRIQNDSEAINQIFNDRFEPGLISPNPQADVDALINAFLKLEAALEKLSFEGLDAESLGFEGWNWNDERDYYLGRLRSFRKYLETGDFKGTPEVSNVSKTLKTLLSHWGTLQAGKIQVTQADSLQAVLIANVDSDHLIAALSNIMSNSFRALDAKKYRDNTFAPRFNLSLEERENQLILTLSDNGPGFPVDVSGLSALLQTDANGMQKLFSRGESASGSSGLGLWIAYRTIENAGGTIRAEFVDAADPSRGARFVITLPRSELRSIEEDDDDAFDPDDTVIFTPELEKTMDDVESIANTLGGNLGRKVSEITVNRIDEAFVPRTEIHAAILAAGDVDLTEAGNAAAVRALLVQKLKELMLSTDSSVGLQAVYHQLNSSRETLTPSERVLLHVLNNVIPSDPFTNEKPGPEVTATDLFESNLKVYVEGIKGIVFGLLGVSQGLKSVSDEVKREACLVCPHSTSIFNRLANDFVMKDLGYDASISTVEAIVGTGEEYYQGGKPAQHLWTEIVLADGTRFYVSLVDSQFPGFGFTQDALGRTEGKINVFRFKTPEDRLKALRQRGIVLSSVNVDTPFLYQKLGDLKSIYDKLADVVRARATEDEIDEDDTRGAGDFRYFQFMILLGVAALFSRSPVPEEQIRIAFGILEKAAEYYNKNKTRMTYKFDRKEKVDLILLQIALVQKELDLASIHFPIVSGASVQRLLAAFGTDGVPAHLRIVIEELTKFEKQLESSVEESFQVLVEADRLMGNVLKNPDSAEALQELAAFTAAGEAQAGLVNYILISGGHSEADVQRVVAALAGARSELREEYLSESDIEAPFEISAPEKVIVDNNGPNYTSLFIRGNSYQVSFVRYSVQMGSITLNIHVPDEEFEKRSESENRQIIEAMMRGYQTAFKRFYEIGGRLAEGRKFEIFFGKTNVAGGLPHANSQKGLKIYAGIVPYEMPNPVTSGKTMMHEMGHLLSSLMTESDFRESRGIALEEAIAEYVAGGWSFSTPDVPGVRSRSVKFQVPQAALDRLSGFLQLDVEKSLGGRLQPLSQVPKYLGGTHHMYGEDFLDAFHEVFGLEKMWPFLQRLGEEMAKTKSDFKAELAAGSVPDYGSGFVVSILTELGYRPADIESFRNALHRNIKLNLFTLKSSLPLVDYSKAFTELLNNPEWTPAVFAQNLDAVDSPLIHYLNTLGYNAVDEVVREDMKTQFAAAHGVIRSELRPVQGVPEDVAVFENLEQSGALSAIARNLGLSFDDRAAARLTRVGDPSQKRVLRVDIGEGEALSTFALLVPLEEALDEKGILDKLQASPYVVRTGGEYDITVNGSVKTVIAAEFLAGTSLEDFIKHLSGSDREAFEKEAIKAFFDVWAKTGYFIEDISLFAGQLTVLPDASGPLTSNGQRYSLKIHDAGGAVLRTPAQAAEVLALFRSVFQETGRKKWEWNEAGSTRAGFFAAVVEGLGEEKGFAALQTAADFFARQNTQPYHRAFVEAFENFKLSRSELREARDSTLFQMDLSSRFDAAAAKFARQWSERKTAEKNLAARLVKDKEQILRVLRTAWGDGSLVNNALNDSVFFNLVTELTAQMRIPREFFSDALEQFLREVAPLSIETLYSRAQQIKIELAREIKRDLFLVLINQSQGASALRVQNPRPLLDEGYFNDNAFVFDLMTGDKKAGSVLVVYDGPVADRVYFSLDEKEEGGRYYDLNALSAEFSKDETLAEGMADFFKQAARAITSSVPTRLALKVPEGAAADYQVLIPLGMDRAAFEASANRSNIFSWQLRHSDAGVYALTDDVIYLNKLDAVYEGKGGMVFTTQDEMAEQSLNEFLAFLIGELAMYADQWNESGKPVMDFRLFRAVFFKKDIDALVDLGFLPESVKSSGIYGLLNEDVSAETPDIEGGFSDELIAKIKQRRSERQEVIGGIQNGALTFVAAKKEGSEGLQREEIQAHEMQHFLFGKQWERMTADSKLEVLRAFQQRHDGFFKVFPSYYGYLLQEKTEESRSELRARPEREIANYVYANHLTLRVEGNPQHTMASQILATHLRKYAQSDRSAALIALLFKEAMEISRDTLKTGDLMLSPRHETETIDDILDVLQFFKSQEDQLKTLDLLIAAMTDFLESRSELRSGESPLENEIREEFRTLNLKAYGARFDQFTQKEILDLLTASANVVLESVQAAARGETPVISSENAREIHDFLFRLWANEIEPAFPLPNAAEYRAVRSAFVKLTDRLIDLFGPVSSAEAQRRVLEAAIQPEAEFGPSWLDQLTDVDTYRAGEDFVNNVFAELYNVQSAKWFEENVTEEVIAELHDFIQSHLTLEGIDRAAEALAQLEKFRGADPLRLERYKAMVSAEASIERAAGLAFFANYYQLGVTDDSGWIETLKKIMLDADEFPEIRAYAYEAISVNTNAVDQTFFDSLERRKASLPFPIYKFTDKESEGVLREVTVQPGLQAKLRYSKQFMRIALGIPNLAVKNGKVETPYLADVLAYRELAIQLGREEITLAETYSQVEGLALAYQMNRSELRLAEAAAPVQTADAVQAIDPAREQAALDQLVTFLEQAGQTNIQLDVTKHQGLFQIVITGFRESPEKLEEKILARVFVRNTQAVESLLQRLDQGETYSRKFAVGFVMPAGLEMDEVTKREFFRGYADGLAQGVSEILFGGALPDELRKALERKQSDVSLRGGFKTNRPMTLMGEDQVKVPVAYMGDTAEGALDAYFPLILGGQATLSEIAKDKDNALLLGKLVARSQVHLSNLLESETLRTSPEELRKELVRALKLESQDADNFFVLSGQGFTINVSFLSKLITDERAAQQVRASA